MYVFVNKRIGTTTPDQAESRVRTADIHLRGGELRRVRHETVIFDIFALPRLRDSTRHNRCSPASPRLAYGSPNFRNNYIGNLYKSDRFPNLATSRFKFSRRNRVLVGQSGTSWSMRYARQTCGAFCVILVAFLSTPSVEAQNTPNLRKLVYKVPPKYPHELKQNAIGGIVRLSISIGANGSVGKISPIGGNPILVDAATLAVRQWKYVPADHPTTTEVQLDFIPSQ